VSLEEDLARRDFTINAIAYHPLRGEWRDPFRGADDLARRLVRAVGDPAERFREDYLRILRAVRFAARFGFAVDPATWEAARASASGLARLSAERIRDEWFKSLVTAQDPGELVRLWIEVGAAKPWLPELLAPSGPVDAQAARARPRDPVRLTALYASDPAAALSRLKASNAERARAAAIASGPPAPEDPSETGARRWLATVGAAADDLLAMHVLRRGTEPSWAPTVRGTRERGDPVSRSQLAIDGRDVQQLGASGPRVGEVLAELLDRVLVDPALNTRERLLDLARELV
jgi:tRNA nucleotidyltransferase (CCA-adding enzyme)